MNSAKCIESYSHHLSQDVEYSHHPMKFPHLPLKCIFSSHLQPLEITGLISVSIVLLSPE